MNILYDVDKKKEGWYNIDRRGRQKEVEEKK